MDTIEKIRESTIAGNMPLVVELTRLSIKEKLNPERVIQEGFIPAMDTVGERFASGEIFIPEMLLAARAMKSGMEKIKPLLIGEKIKYRGKIILGTVKGDMHDIGKNLVSIMLEGAGFEVIDLGVDVPPENFENAVIEHQPNIVGLSALLTTTMECMARTIQKLEQNNIKNGVKVLVGGAPITQKFADDIGADAYAANAGDAVNIAKQMLAVQ